MPVARILFPMPLPEPFDYLIPEGMDVEPGSYVRAPLGKYERTGVVWAVKQAVPDRELKTIEHHFDVPPMTSSMRRFVEFLRALQCCRSRPGAGHGVAGAGRPISVADADDLRGNRSSHQSDDAGAGEGSHGRD